MACIDDETLARYAEGSLDVDAIALVDEHVDGCHTCRRVLAETVAAGEGVVAFEPGPSLQSTGRYRVLRLIGRGGMGVVFEAVDQRLGVPVALKTLRDLDGAMLLRLKSEFRSLADLRHPNLVRLGELVQEDRSWFFTMELIRGRDFLGHVRPTPAGCDEARLREALAQLAEGVSALHRARKVHRDLKPSNILVEHGGRVVVLDFGLVAESDRRPDLDPHAGTPEYMAPEQRAGGPVGPAADWYAVGVMLYEALTGSRPSPPDRDALGGAPADLAELCLDLLSPDPAERPGADELRARLGQQPPPAPLPPAAPFVGRLAELERLRAALGAAGASLRVLVVEGESGVGKTALVRRFVEEAGAAGACVLRGRCHERESVSYKALDGIVDALSRHLAALPEAARAELVPDDVGLIADAFPVLLEIEATIDPRHAVLRPRDPAERRRGMSRALRGLLARLARSVPLVLTIDDLQWSDADSVALLAELLRPPEAPPLLLVGTLRSGTPLDLPCPVERIALGPLPPAEARVLARHCLEASAGEARAAAVAEETGGHPLFIAELAHHSVAAATGPVTLDGALGARVAALPEQPRAVLELLAVAAGPVGEEALARASGQPADVHDQSVALLRAERLARSGGQSVETYHDRVRAAVSGRLDGEGRRRCHERLAIGLEAVADGDAEMLAVHWHAAGHDQRAAQHAVRAADRAAAALAFERAARLYRMAIALDPTRTDLTELRTSLANVLVNDGRQGEAGDAFLAAARGATGAAAVDLKRRAAQHLLASHHVDRGLPILDEVLAAVGLRRARTNRRVVLRMILLRLRLALRGFRFRARPEAEVPPPLLARIDVCGSSWIGLGLSNQLLPAAEFHTRFLADALRAGEPRRLALGFAAEVFFACLLGPDRLRRAVALMPVAEELAAQGTDPLPRARLASVRGVVSWVGGRWGESEEILARAQELIRQQCIGANLERQLVLYTLLCTRVYTGKIDLMRAVIRQEMREAEAREDRWVALLYGASGYAAFVRLADGDVEEARRHVDRAARSALPAWAISTSRMAIAFYDDDRAGLRQELEGLRRQWPSLERTQLLRHPIDGVRLCDLRGRAAATLALGAGPDEKPALLREARQVAVWLDRRPAAWAAPHADLLRALVAAAENDRAGCARALEKAAAGFTAAELPMHAAALRRRLGELVGGEEGRAHLAAAAPWFEREQISDPAAFTRLFAPPLA
jgi:hypothetical protein